jgi:exoribonuclease R
MITSNIDGSSGNGSQLMDLLAVVAADPAGYQSKLKEIQAATNEHKKFVGLVGPAAEILTIQKQIAVDKQNADAYAANSKTTADTLVVDAKAKAVDINAQAQALADKTIASANLLAEETTALNLTAKQNNKALTYAIAKANTATEIAKQKASALATELDKATRANNEAHAAKAELLAKHQAFIASL